MKVLIVGGSKFIGKEIASKAAAAGLEVALFNRGKTDPDSPFHTIVGDVENIAAAKRSILEFNPKIVIHCIANTAKHSHDMHELFAARDVRLLVLGSCDCYDFFQQLNRGKEATDFPVNEEDPTSQIQYYWRDLGSTSNHHQTYDKNLMTDSLLSAHQEGRLQPVIFRLPLVYGPNDYQFPGRHGPIIQRVLDQQLLFPIGSTTQSNLRTHGFVENIAAAIVHAIHADGVVGEIFNLGERNVRSHRRWGELYAKAGGVEFDFRLLPEEFLFGDPSIANCPPQHILMDVAKFTRVTGFTEPVPVTEAIAKTLAWAGQHRNALGKQIDYEAERAMLERYDSLRHGWGHLKT